METRVRPTYRETSHYYDYPLARIKKERWEKNYFTTNPSLSLFLPFARINQRRRFTEEKEEIEEEEVEEKRNRM